MPFGNSKDQQLLKEFTIKVGTIAAPETIGTDNTDPRTKFTGDLIGYIETQTQNYQFPREYTELLNGTPQQLIRKDMIRKQFFIEANLTQWNIDLLELVFGFTTQPAYAITIPDVQTHDLAHIGPEEGGACAGGVFFAYMAESEFVNCDPTYIIMYEGIQTSESLALTFGGGYVTYPMKVEATPAPTVTDAEKSYGVFGTRIA